MLRRQKSGRRKTQAQAETVKVGIDFLTNVSHEMRTPLCTVLGVAERALESSLPPEQRESFELIKSAADSLKDLVNDLLDLAQIQAGKFALREAPFRLRQLVGTTVRLFTPRARQQGLALVCDVNPDVQDEVIGDAARLRQVLVNLLGNALKFTRTGHVSVRVEATTSGERRLTFAVEDTGIGISADRQRTIFDRFARGDHVEGTGLGLTIAAELVHLMGGAIDVESRVGVGSTFRFWLPLRVASASVEPAKRLSVLVVDDNELHRDLSGAKLRELGHEVRAVASGRERLAAVRESAFDVVFLDLRLPDADGSEVARDIRACAGQTAIVALTADSLDDAGGFVDGYVAKPACEVELARVLREVMVKPPHPNPPPRRGEGEDGSPPHTRAIARSREVETSKLDDVFQPTQSDDLLARVNGNLDLLKRLFALFRVDSVRLALEMKEALTERDAARFRLAAHTTRGMLDFLHGAEAVNKVRQLETLARENRWSAAEGMFDDALAAIRRLESEVAATIGGLP